MFQPPYVQAMNALRTTAVAVLVLGACARQSEPDDSFFVHPRFLEVMERAAADPDALYQPAVTDWAALPTPLPFDEVRGASSPEELMERLKAAVTRDDEVPTEGELSTLTRLRDVTGTSAVGALLRHGYLDDSVAGEGWSLELRRDGDGWYVAEAEHRWFCRRGVAGPVNCV